MEQEVTVTRSDLVKIFTRWNEAAREGAWEDRDDPQASADAFLGFANDVI